MRALRNCDFCADDAVGVYEVLPPELDPEEDEQRRIALCEGCRDQLATVLDPLMTRLGGRRADGTTASSTGASTSSTSPLTETRLGTESGGRGRSSRGSEGTAGSTGTTGRETSETASSSETADRSTPSAATRSGSNEPDRSTADDGSDEGGRSTPTASTDRRIPSASSDGETPPPGYGSVMRLLENREFPVERESVEALASGAYDLEGEQAAAIIDHAIEEGKLTEKRRKLYRA